MRHEELLERRMAAWLKEGPDDAPARPVEAACAYAREHPYGRPLLGRPWRTIVGHLDLEPQRHPLLRFSSALVGLAAAAALLIGGVFVVAGGLGRGGVVGPPVATPTPPATSSPSLTPTPTPTMPPVTSPLDVTGTITCTLMTGVPTKVGSVEQYRGVAIPCGLTLSDARVSGAVSTVMDIDQQPDESAEVWGTSTITNSGGIWSGAWRGTVDAGYTVHHVAGVYIGSGGYESLRFRYQFEGAGSTFSFSGTLERSDMVPAAGTTVVYGEACAAMRAPDGTATAGVTTYRGVRLACTGPMSDPRLAGDFAVVADIAVKPDQSATLQGTTTITSSRGGWTGSWTGTVDAGYTTHRMQGLLTGTGAYAGLTMPFTQIGTDRDGYVLTGTIVSD
jgi:hypothetical protein